MIRGTLVGLIHSRSSVAQSRENDEGKAVTLMSNDVNNLEESAAMFHETWAQVLEVMVGMLLLARQVGWVWPLPLFFIFCKFGLHLLLYTTNRQRQCARK